MEQKKKKILVVEDSGVDARLLCRLIEDLDFDVAGPVATGEAAVESALNDKPDLVVMDILLAGEIDGITASHEIRRHRDIPVVFSSSLSDREILDKLEISDSYGYLLKPFRKRDLFITIDLALRRYEFESRLEESELRYQSLFEKSMDAIYVADKKGCFINVNRAMVELFGFSSRELMTMRIDDFAVYDEELKDFHRSIKTEEHVRDFEMVLKRQDGINLSCMISSSVMKSRAGRVRFHQGIIRDNTEKKIAEQSLEQHVFSLERAMYEIEDLNERLQQKVDDLNEAYRRISLSEEKYRRLVEGSNDIIFSLDDQYRFITANKALVHQLQVQPDMMKKRPLMELIYADPEEQQVSHNIVETKLREVIQERKPVSFKAHFKSKYTVEPKELQVKLECVNIKGKNEILGKASRVMDDALMKHFISEQQKFMIDNSLVTADEITYRLTRNVAKYLPQKEITMLRVALREVIINAIEHGNLDISFEDKSKALIENRYIHFISERQKDPRCRKRRVTIEYQVDPGRVTYRIADEGAGFDHTTMLNASVESLNEAMSAHGRGLRLCQDFFDTIRFNERGNEVELIKNFSPSEIKKEKS